ncbi:hypothetical protein ANO14919_075540 [Xylariales sp. No.14919]|nr:hypothetical protein ANO14919_075540 [Xylariales sp. No.14919]
MKLLSIPALLAGAAQAFSFVNDYNYGSYHTAGSNFVISWEEIRPGTDTFKLELATYLVKALPGPLGPEYNFTSFDLDGAVRLSDGNYTWPIEIVQGREGENWFYAFIAFADDQFIYSREFHVQAASS